MESQNKKPHELPWEERWKACREELRRAYGLENDANLGTLYMTLIYAREVASGRKKPEEVGDDFRPMRIKYFPPYVGRELSEEDARSLENKPTEKARKMLEEGREAAIEALSTTYFARSRKILEKIAENPVPYVKICWKYYRPVRKKVEKKQGLEEGIVNY